MIDSMSNEGKACDAVLRELEARLVAPRGRLIFPKEPDFPRDQQVELIVPIGDETFAVEHTLIEPFEGFMNIVPQVGPFSEQLQQRVSEAIPPGASFDVTIPVNVLDGRKPRELKLLLTRIGAWVSELAPRLPHDTNDRAKPEIRPADAEIPFEVTIRRRDWLNHPPLFRVLSVVPWHKEELRRARLKRAYDDKAPKLTAVKNARKATRTVLVLEENDLAGTNQYFVGDAARRVELSRTDCPDELYLLSTPLSKGWHLYPLRIGRRWVFDVDEPVQRFRSFYPGALVDITTEGRRSREPKDRF